MGPGTEEVASVVTAFCETLGLGPEWAGHIDIVDGRPVPRAALVVALAMVDAAERAYFGADPEDPRGPATDSDDPRWEPRPLLADGLPAGAPVPHPDDALPF